MAISRRSSSLGTGPDDNVRSVQNARPATPTLRADSMRSNPPDQFVQTQKSTDKPVAVRESDDHDIRRFRDSVT